MGNASARKEIAADLRRKIGDNAAAAVGELRELLEQTNKNARALAVGLAQAEKRIDTAAAAPAALRLRVDELAEQLEALGLRLQSMPAMNDAIANAQTSADVAARHAESVHRRVSGRREHFERMTFRQRVSWLLFGRVPPPPRFDSRTLRYETPPEQQVYE